MSPKRIVPVVVGVIKKDDQYLLTKRVHVDDRFYGKWQFPGGELEWGESLEDCLLREIKEEVGVDVGKHKPIPVVFEAIWPDWHGLLIPFLCSLRSKNPKITLDNEASTFDWFKRNRVMKLTTLAGTKKYWRRLSRLGHKLV